MNRKFWKLKRSSHQERRESALKAWRTRKENERKRKASEAARKAWRTRRNNQNR